ncbi:MAG TPA: sialidase family protein, partial [Candidatus Dormibacteraeota bacterium]|nr:sialidase family protein [Candidatus Dormibacteraeota bacterium]
SGQCAASQGANNIKVNVNCLNLSDSNLQGRGQANNETSIAENPFAPKQLVASDNDYIRGDGTCGSSYSTDSGTTWNNSTVPNGFTSGASFGGFARQYWQGGGDTSVAWDTRGNAYMACQLFNRGSGTSSNPDQASTFAVFRSTGNGGASWNFPGHQVTFGPASGVPFEDKELLTVDNNVSSPFRDRVYVTWTEFAADGSAYIYESYSSDYGQTFSARVLVSKTSPRLCTNAYGISNPNGSCDENQFSQPFAGSDGALYVTYDNYNNPVRGSDNRNQILLSKSTDGGASFSSPVKVSDYYDLPDCDTYQGGGADSFRACVPEKGGSTVSVFRATNYSSGQVNPTNASQVVVTLGSYINQDSNESNGCVPASFSSTDGQDLYTGVKTAGACNNKILISVSNDAGKSFSGGKGDADPRTEAMVTQGAAQNGTDQFWQWTAFTTGGTFAVDYYDRQYPGDETSGSSDYSLSTSSGLTAFNQQRVTSSSMPAPTQFEGPKGGQFYGDYTGLTAVTDIHPIWSDTRNADMFLCPGSATGPGTPPALCMGTEPNGQQANDQEIYTGTFAP